MTRTHRLAVVGLLILAGLVGCDRQGSGIGSGDIDFADNGDVIVHIDDRPPAVITAAPGLTIGNRPISLTDRQRAELADFYRGAHRIASAGMDVGKAGGRLGLDVVKALALRVVYGKDQETIESAMAKRVAGFQTHVNTLCDGIGQLRDTETTLARDLPVFAPYASTIGKDDTDGCRKRLHDIAADTSVPHAGILAY